MKANVTTKAAKGNKAKADAKAPVKVTVPASIKNAVAAVIDAAAFRSAAAKKEEKSWLVCGEALRKLFKTKEDAAPVLKQAFEDAGKTDLKYSSYRSNILTLAYPGQMEKALKQAEQDGLDTHKLLAVVRGNLKKSKKKDGGYIKVKREENRGGHNKLKPTEKMDKDLVLIATHYFTAKLDEDQLAVSFAKAFKPDDDSDNEFDIDAFVDKLKEQFE